MDEIYSGLVPKAVLSACSKESNAKVTPLPACINAEGTIAIVDLSGYTALTELLFASSTNNGGERVYETVNPFFAGIIDLVDKYDGDVVKFCGDALIVSWATYANTGQLEHARKDTLANAIMCSFEVLRQYSSFKIPVKTAPKQRMQGGWKGGGRDVSNVELSVHIGIGHGSIAHCFVGKALQRAEYFILGAAIQEASEMLKSTHRGEIAMRLDHWLLIKDSLAQFGKFVPVRQDSHFTETAIFSSSSIKSIRLDAISRWATTLKGNYHIPARIDAPIQNFIVTSAVERLNEIVKSSPSEERGAGFQLQLNELRRVTAVFLRINSPRLNTNQSADKLNFCQEVFSILKGSVHDCKGHLRQIVYDDKGFTALLIWGLPPSSSEDESLAMKCALQLKDAMKPLNEVEFAIGVSSGKCYTGIIGNARRQDYNLFGQCINLVGGSLHGRIYCKVFNIMRGKLNGANRRWVYFHGAADYCRQGHARENKCSTAVKRGSTNRERPEHKETKYFKEKTSRVAGGAIDWA
ncbi:Adenylate cyclase type 10 [Blyttiomyces sp. JEL0837]|nr:Adenylate cyclase type 10 [Blyttiomyces sp. JEL0837]